jgi:hypothetical protein
VAGVANRALNCTATQDTRLIRLWEQAGAVAMTPLSPCCRSAELLQCANTCWLLRTCQHQVHVHTLLPFLHTG